MSAMPLQPTSNDDQHNSDSELNRIYPISTRINSVANDDEACSAPVELAQIQNRLFS